MAKETEDAITSNWLKEAQKGYIRIGVLILLNKKPAHGYEIMKEIDNRTKGFWQPTPGGVYPILRDLEKSGYIKGEWQTHNNRRLKVYKITASGELIIKRAIVKQTEISANIGNLFQEFARDVLNVEMTTNPMSQMRSLFKPFLDEKTDLGQNLKTLERNRKHICDNMKVMKDRLKLIDKRITEIKEARKDAV
jgi:DNA-binding PadR family transcriptional regulator